MNAQAEVKVIATVQMEGGELYRTTEALKLVLGERPRTRKSATADTIQEDSPEDYALSMVRRLQETMEEANEKANEVAHRLQQAGIREVEW